MSTEGLPRMQAISICRPGSKNWLPGYTPSPDGEIVSAPEDGIRYVVNQVAARGVSTPREDSELTAFLSDHLQAVINPGPGLPRLVLVGHEYHDFDGSLPNPLKHLVQASRAVGVEYIPEEIFRNLERFPTPAVARKVLRMDRKVEKFRRTMQGTRAQADAADAKKGGNGNSYEGKYSYCRFGWFQSIIDEANSHEIPYFSSDIANTASYMLHRFATGMLSVGFLGDMETFAAGRNNDSLYTRVTKRELGMREMDMEQLRRMVMASSFDHVSRHVGERYGMPDDTSSNEPPFVLITWPELHVAGMVEYYKQLRGVNPSLEYPLAQLIRLNTLLHPDLDYRTRFYKGQATDPIDTIDLREQLPSLFSSKESLRQIGLAVQGALKDAWKYPLK